MKQGLFPEERQQEIMRILRYRQRATVGELSNVLAVSEVTVRKDLVQLENSGLIRRTHGGALLTQLSPYELAFDVRAKLQQAEKERIAAAAATLVQNGDSIALDASTTAYYLARVLSTYNELTVVTNGIRIGMELAGRPGINVLMPGGTLRYEAFSLVGGWGEEIFKHIHIKHAFVGAMGFTLNEGLTDVNSEEVKIKSAMVEKAKDVIAIFDHTKWQKVSFATFCSLDQVRLIITGRQAPEDMVMQVRSLGVEVWLV